MVTGFECHTRLANKHLLLKLIETINLLSVRLAQRSQPCFITYKQSLPSHQ